MKEKEDNKELLKEAFIEATLRSYERDIKDSTETAEVSLEYKIRMNKFFKDIGSSFIPYPDI